MNQELEVSDELRDLKVISAEISQHTKRILALKSEGKLSAVLSDEIASTVLPLLGDLSTAVLKHSALVEDLIQDLAEDIENGPTGADLDLTQEDVDLLLFNNARYRDFIMGAKGSQDTSPEVVKAMLELEIKLNEGEKILKRLNEYVEAQEEDAEEDGDDDSEKENGDGDDS